MVIDFHTHIYPDALAPRLMHDMCDKYWGHYAKGNLQGLLASMKHGGIDYSVTLPVATKPSQFESINRFAQSQFEVPGLIPFGAIHPDNEEIPAKLKQLVSMGFKGIKLHPDWQDTYVDDDKYVYLIREALAAGLIVTLHSGQDDLFIDNIHNTPERALRLVEQLEDPGQEPHKLIFAHNGSLFFHDQVMKYMAGLPVYFDVSLSFGYMSDDQFMELVKAQGVDRLLFASDCPFADQRWSLLKLKQRPLSRDAYEKIAGLNAAKLLGLEV